MESSKIILIGNPNVGKSVIFNYITGRYVTVSNYPGTTVEIAHGMTMIKGKRFPIIDTPGVNSLIPMSEDEKVTRDILLKERNKFVIQVIDSKNLRRGLLISIQLLELGIPFIIILNMWDEAKSRNIEIEIQILSKILNVPVIKAIATRKKGLEKIKENIGNPITNPYLIHYPEAIEEGISNITDLLPDSPISKRSLALMLLSGDESLLDWLYENLSADIIKKIEKIRQEVQSKFFDPLGYIINHTRMKKIDEIITQVMRIEEKESKNIITFIGNLSIHPVWGIPILIFVLFITYEFVGVFGAQICVDFLEDIVFQKWLLPPLTHLIHSIIPISIIREFFIGPYGVFTMALTYAIAIVLPIIGTFFIIFGIMEDSGYLPRLAVMTNNIFKKLGLNGKAILPMVLGLGCGTMATMTARILDTKKDRIIVTLLLALGVPCSAQLGVIVGMFSGLPMIYLTIWIFVIISVLITVGYISSKIITGERSDFMLEIPPIRIPQISNLLVKTLARIEWYLREAVPLFILGTIILFFFNHLKILNLIEKVGEPLIVHLLNLPSKVTEAFIIGFLRRDYGAAGLFVLARDGKLTPHQILVSLVTITLFIPCIAQFFMMIKERGLKNAIYISLSIFPIAFGVGGILNYLLKIFGL